MKDKLRFLMSAAWAFLLPLIKVMLTQAGIALMDSAQKAVEHVRDTINPDVPNETKHSVAFRMILEDLKQKGIDIGKSFIDIAIKLAVKKMNGE